MKRSLRPRPDGVRVAWLSVCGVSGLCTLLMASQVRAEEASADGRASSSESSAALFAWADFDGDSRLDLAAVGTDGRLQLLASVDDERLEDVTEQVGLAGIANAALALWGDYDNDGRIDLFVGAREGQSRLFHNDAGVWTCRLHPFESSPKNSNIHSCVPSGLVANPSRDTTILSTSVLMSPGPGAAPKLIGASRRWDTQRFPRQARRYP